MTYYLAQYRNCTVKIRSTALVCNRRRRAGKLTSSAETLRMVLADSGSKLFALCSLTASRRCSVFYSGNNPHRVGKCSKVSETSRNKNIPQVCGKLPD